VKTQAVSSESRPRLRVRVGYLLALVWVVVGSVLYAVEVARLVISRG
jgi:carbon starvation protein CstA